MPIDVGKGAAVRLRCRLLRGFLEGNNLPIGSVHERRNDDAVFPSVFEMAKGWHAVLHRELADV
ncbi:hypothetical protein ZHAS_00017503 [Anopheles sinensis]|uniref:Uncharacterized protein n=1 Tax=Anopheles sinensis TaxID=74873 RepID=A0A084WGQ8_ANOSI|nr:hypothetical protein ZHAS_00017503 [Anopheles sinensis]